MFKIICVSILILFLNACKTNPNADKRYADSKEDRVYKLRLNPTQGSTYKYDIQNETEMKLEVDDKKIDNINKTSVIVNYFVNKDSSGNFGLRIKYDKIHLYTKNGDTETDADAANASNSINSIERMLGVLKDAILEATISPSGEVKSVKGYKEIGAKLISGMDVNDTYSRSIAQSRWDQVIGEGMIKKNMNDLFAIFPDSAVHVGDKWKISSKQKSEIPLTVITTYRLKEIDEGIAVLSVDAAISGEPGTINYMGTDVTADLNGEQDGEYQIDIKSGMLKSCEIRAKIKGTLQTLDKEIPVNINAKVSMHSLAG